MTDTITNTRTLQYRLGVWTNPSVDYSPMPGVEYLGEYAEVPQRFDWAGSGITPEQWERIVRGYVDAYAQGTGAPPRYHALAGDWTWVPDAAPEATTPILAADNAPESRNAQSRAMQVMRRREAEALASVERLTRERDAAREQHSTLRGRMSSLADALLEEAETRDWCSEYESFVETNGFDDILHKRVKSGHVHVTITVRVDVDDVDDVDSIDTDDVRNAILYSDGWDGDFETGDVCED